MSKYGKIRVSTKKPWEVSRGHNGHRSGLVITITGFAEFAPDWMKGEKQ